MKKNDSGSFENQLISRIEDIKEAITESDLVVISSNQFYAVGLKYLPLEYDAPFVTAKGTECLAGIIIETAEDNEIPIAEDSPTARILFHNTDVGGFIPPELYGIVSKIFAHAYEITGKLD